MTSLNTDDMIEVANTFLGSLDHVLSNYIDDTKTDIKKFIADVVLREKPYMLVSPEGLTHAIDLAFSNEQHRDFILTLQFTFLSRWGHTDEALFALITNIARGAGINYINNTTAIPFEIKQRLSLSQSIVSLLESNVWLVTLLMLQLFVSVNPDSKAKK